MADSPLFWPVSELVAAYRAGDLSPVEVAKDALYRIDRYGGDLNAYVTVTEELLADEAERAASAYGAGDERPLLGVPIAVKDVFHVAGVPTTCGSLVLREQVAVQDSGMVRRLRSAGAMVVGKTNVPEFCQSATTENLLGPDTANPWDVTRTAGGSSGGTAAAVAAGLASVGVGSDGGGSIRIPAAFTGLVGVKPGTGLCRDEHGFRTMSEFASPGPMARTVADARILLGVLADRPYPRRDAAVQRVAWCPRPAGAPVDRDVASLVGHVPDLLAELAHDVAEYDLPVHGWEEIFAPLVLAEEHRERGHLLALAGDQLTRYVRNTLRAGRDLAPQRVAAAERALVLYRERFTRLFDTFDVLVCPATAVPAFPLGERPRVVAGERVRRLWGAFPFTSPFNVAGIPTLTLPCGLAAGLPVGVQLAMRPGDEQVLLDVTEELERALRFDRSPVSGRWADSLLVETG